MNTTDWLNTTPDEFLQRHAPHAASRRGNLAPPLRGNSGTRATFDPTPLPRPVAAIATPHDSNPNTKDNQMMIDRLTLEALMKSDTNEIMTFNGRTCTVAEHLRAILKGEGTPYEPPVEPQAPGQQPRGSIRIDPARLTEAQRMEMERTGNLAGFTSSDRDRALISVRNSSGTIVSRHHFDDATGKIEAGETRPFSYDPTPTE